MGSASTAGAGKSDLSQVIHHEEGVRVGPDMLTRRQFARAAAATTAAALAGARAAQAGEASPSGEVGASAKDGGSSSADAPQASEQRRASDSNDVITSVLDFEDKSATTPFKPLVTYELPLGSQVFMDCDKYAAVLQANRSARPLTVVGCLDLGTGSYSVVLPAPVDDACAPSECHITERLIAWVETDNATDAWALYAAPFSGGAVSLDSGVTKLAEGDADWLPPQVAAYESTVVWQVMPDPSGPHVRESSHAYRWEVGSSDAKDILASPGRFACAPAINDGVLTVVPRVRADEGTYYGITALDLDHQNEQVDQLVLPASVRPYFATRIGDDFAFSIEASYDSSTGDLGRMGYYVGRGDGPFLALRREPSAQVTYVGGKYVMRSQLYYFVVDPRDESYAVLGSASGCVDYGDYPATRGTATYFVTYAAVKDESTGIPSRVIVRTFTLS